MFAITRRASLKLYEQRLVDIDGYANRISLNVGKKRYISAYC